MKRAFLIIFLLTFSFIYAAELGIQNGDGAKALIKIGAR